MMLAWLLAEGWLHCGGWGACPAVILETVAGLARGLKGRGLRRGMHASQQRLSVIVQDDGVVYENEGCAGLTAWNHSGPWVAFAEYLDNACVLQLW